MNTIAFVDTETDSHSGKVLDIGGIRESGATFHKSSITEFEQFLNGMQFICGHNIIRHDIKYIGEALQTVGIDSDHIIDTLFLSPLLFPTKPYHALLKDDKLQTDETNNPLNDAIKARELFYDEVDAFKRLDAGLQKIFYGLLNTNIEFHAFFQYVGYHTEISDLKVLIQNRFENEICLHANLGKLISENPIELAYALSLINSLATYHQVHSITPRWVLKNYPHVESDIFLLRNKPCMTGCVYCDKALDIHRGLKRWFGFENYRTYGGEPLQEKAVKAAIDNKSILAVFPTGGGKSVTFQVPALMSGENCRGLTVVISPLQSLMKDQVDNLEKVNITEAVTINGLLDPVERAKSFERVENGSASLLYISPESLRSRTIERLLLGRKIIRFVIDEAHCFSAWGQDFRVDYMYIGDFIKSIKEKKNLTEPIPVSCFTATAKRKVIEDIRAYFREKLSIDLTLFTSRTSRTNLHYKVFEKGSEEEKYQMTRLLLEERNCPTIVYVSRTQKAFDLAQRLTADGFKAKPYHGKMDVKEKTENQNAFISGEVPVMVATSAFGMGVDKKDVGMVIHYEISDSLENYIQEAGRAGRDENNTADCYVLFNEEDLSKHFILLNQTRLSIKEIQQVWKAIKEITKFRSSVSNSALEIARQAGWDDSVKDIETRVITAIAALEEAGYLKRGQNMTKVFADSILSKSAHEAIEKINVSTRFNEKQKTDAARIIRKLFSSKSRKQSEDEGESRVDYISDHLGIVKENVIEIINLLREESILADAKDLTAFIRRKEHKNHSLQIVESYADIENFLLPLFEKEAKTFHLKELNEDAEKAGCKDVTPKRIKTIINIWAIRNWIVRKRNEFSRNHLMVSTLFTGEELKEKLQRRHELAKFIVDYLFRKLNSETHDENSANEELLVDFSILEMKKAFEKQPGLFVTKVENDDIEDALFYLSRTEAIKIEGGFLITYNRLMIERLETDNKKRYKAGDYQKLNQFYENKVQQIHIVGEYAKKMIEDYKAALQFVDDYFQLNYSSFLNKYFKGSRQNEIKRNLTPAKFRQLFGELSPAQLKIINDKDSKYIVVAAGPGSGKTRVLVHKLASLLLMEDVKHEQLLMLTFSRAAATEFKKRLLQLIGNAANFIDIKTFHSYCFDLLGKVGNLEKADDILKITIDKIKRKEVEISRITRTVVVIDEAQDMDADEFGLVKMLMEQNEEMRVIAVGDDDQNIFEFRGSSSKYLEQLIKIYHARKYELIENYRSKRNLVEFTNQFAKSISHRLKDTPVVTKKNENGKIKIVGYERTNLVTPLVEDILRTDLSGTTCVLTRTNEEAVQITGVLLKNRIKARLIQTNDGFNLYNLSEIRFFLHQLNLPERVFVINDDVWTNARRKLSERYGKSSKLEVINNIIKEFEAINPKRKYKSDLEVFIRESKLEDFFNTNGETVFVSTIHKSKGREFDNLFLLLDNFNASTDELKRQLYVAMTRAKENLTIHLNAEFLNNVRADNLIKVDDKEKYQSPDELVMQLTFKDVWLDYFINRDYLISQLTSGEALKIAGNECLNENGKSVLRFSGQFLQQIEDMKAKHYQPVLALINFIVYWYKEETKQEVKIILPEIHFKKSR